MAHDILLLILGAWIGSVLTVVLTGLFDFADDEPDFFDQNGEG